MAFVKLDRDILRSTIWFDRPAREVFITALLLAEPQEFADPVSQIEVGSLDETGWRAPPGWYGFVPASGPGIVHAAKVPMDEGTAALNRLGEAEPESRSQDFGGRRMIRIDGGYLILNFMKHRDKDHTSKFRSARYRERLKGAASHRDATATSRDVTYARMPLPMPNPSDSGSDPDPEGTTKGRKPRKPRVSKPLCTVPLDFAPNAGHAALAAEQGVSLDEELPKFIDHHTGKGTLWRDWDASFRLWLRNAKTFSARSTSVGGASRGRVPNSDALDYAVQIGLGKA